MLGIVYNMKHYTLLIRVAEKGERGKRAGNQYSQQDCSRLYLLTLRDAYRRCNI